MDQPPAPTAPDERADLDLDDLPPGDHALEVAARKGFGPLSPIVKRVWHGDAVPCVTCGQLVRRGDDRCDHCGQDLSEEMVEKMRAHAGPWYVLEHLRPFPGVALDRIVRQIRRGLITETSIVRGPSTDYQWRFAVETPGLCRYFGKCWHCHHEVRPSDTYCQGCLSHLSFEKPRPLTAIPAAEPRDSSRAGSPTHPEPRASARAGSPTHPEPQASARADVPSPRAASGSERTSLTGAPPSGTGDRPSTHTPASVEPPASPVLHPGGELAKLANVVHHLEAIPASNWDGRPRLGPLTATWIAVAILLVAIIGLIWMARVRSQGSPPPSPTPTSVVLPSSS